MLFDILSSHPLLITILALFYPALYLSSKYLARKDASDSHIPGCSRLGLVGRSNMTDQYDAVHNGHSSTSNSRVKALFVYPIKSCGIIELSETDIVASGFRYDRQFCFAQLHTEPADSPKNEIGVNTKWKHTWKFITQRKIAQLCQLHTELWLPDVSAPDYSPDLEWVKSGGCLVCKFAFTPDWEWTSLFESNTLQNVWTIIRAKLSAGRFSAEPLVTFRLPLAPNGTRLAAYTRETMQIWKDSPEAINVTSEIAPDTLAKLKYLFGLSNPLGLFMADPLKRRDVFRNAPRKEEAGYQPGIGFADAYPLSMMALASVQDVATKINGRTKFTLDARRFRANIYVTGASPYAEDSWKLIRMGQLTYHVSCRTTRCELPNVDQDTGERHRQEPLRTLKNSRAYVDEGAGADPCLGMSMVPLLEDEASYERLAVGDSVEVLETGEHFYVRMFQPGEQYMST